MRMPRTGNDVRSSRRCARRALLAAAVPALALAACAAHAPRAPDAETQAPPDFPERSYRQAAASGSPVYRVDPASSRVLIVVRRAGALARLGHDHVVAGRDVRGYVAPAQGRSDLYVRLDRLTVDEPGLRAEAKLDTQPSDEDIAGTRRNMLAALKAAAHPFARIGIERRDTDGAESRLAVAVTLNGVTRTRQVPVRIVADRDEIVVTGALSLTQTEFGIEPLSVLGGAIQVRDLVDLRYEIHARRVEDVAAAIPDPRPESGSVPPATRAAAGQRPVALRTIAKYAR
jgi:hypothetical protein